MYKGAYTANTLPAYVPKGKHVEMLNCGVSLQPHNLFDNSDFRNPVNSRGITSTEASGYHIDKWKKENESGKVTVGNGYLSMTGTGTYWFLTQYIEQKKIKSGAVYTIALADTSGSISICSTVMSTNMTKFTARHTFTSGAVVITNVEYASDKYSIYFTSNSSKETRFAWAVLYEGFYTADTLPAYVPKGKHVEMLNCGVSLVPYNLLDNSDFTNPVNQRGATTTSQYKYFLDRWIARLSDISLAVGNSGLTLTSSATANIFIYQKLSAEKALNGKTVTVAVCDGTGNVATTTTNIPTTNATSWTSYAVAQTNNGVYASVIDLGSGDYPIAVRVGVQSDALNKTIRWVALYEGSYTADTLPAYVPKGYAAELAECQRYYQPLNHQLLGSGYTFNGGATLLVPRKMRIDAPSFVASGTITARVNGADYPLTLSSVTTYGSMIKVDFASNNIPVLYPCAFYADAPGVSLNADL